MLARGLLPDFDAASLKQLAEMRVAPIETGADFLDLRNLLWCSIDNDDSRDLDQLTVSEEVEQGGIKLLIAVADVDTLVKKSTPIDGHAATVETTYFTSETGGGYYEVFAEFDAHADSVVRVTVTAMNEPSQRVGLTIVRSLRFTNLPAN